MRLIFLRNYSRFNADSKNAIKSLFWIYAFKMVAVSSPHHDEYNRNRQ